MEFTLSAPAIRVLGCLLEKEMTTPDYYPLSLNALVNACNQKTNRFPVVDFDEKTVVRALEELKELRIAWQSDASRVSKYGENFAKTRNLLTSEAALVCLLLLRGPQTPGELRGRSERMYAFATIEEVEKVIGTLVEIGFVTRLPRQPGRKEARYAHLLGEATQYFEESFARPKRVTVEAQDQSERLSALVAEVADLRRELTALRGAFVAFKKEFE